MKISFLASIRAERNGVFLRRKSRHLVRWNKPVEERIQPRYFCHSDDSQGVLDEWGEVCATLPSLPATVFTTRVGVNYTIRRGNRRILVLCPRCCGKNRFLISSLCRGKERRCEVPSGLSVVAQIVR